MIALAQIDCATKKPGRSPLIAQPMKPKVETMSGKNDNLKHIPIPQIRASTVALRDVNKEDEKYVGLVDSVKQVGVLLPITVREMRDPETGQKYYALIDGLHRYNAAQDAGLDEVPCHILTLDEVAVLEAQLMANIHRVETKPVEYAKQLARILAHNPLLTQSELSVRLGMSPTWVGQRLGLIKLDGKIQGLADDGTINLSNAICLSKLPAEEQGNFVDRAMTMTPAEFTGTVNARVKELRDAKLQGRAPAATEFVPVPHLRKLGEIKSELEHTVIGPALVKESGLKRPEEIWKAAIKWVLSVDDPTVAVSKAKFDARKAEMAAAATKRAEDRQAAKAAKAAQTQDAVTAAA